jgi:hypothetical protein
MRQDPKEKLSARLAAGREIVTALTLAAHQKWGFDRQELLALALRIKLCNSPSNTFYCEDAFSRETGECFEAIGNLWSCGSKLCPQCLARQSVRNRKRLRDAMNRQTLRRGERYYFITFTIPNPSLGLTSTRSIVDRAWCLFRKRELCVSLIRGGAKSEEFTLTANGFHYHLHAIFLSRFLLYDEVRRVWTECVKQAFEDAREPLVIKGDSGMVRVNIKPITERERSIHEVCKYITKSDSWYKMPPEDLADIALIRRWHRMFELIGSFREANNPSKTESDDAEPSTPNVHTSSLSDAGGVATLEYWRDTVERIGLEAYAERLDEEISRTWTARLEQLHRRWPSASIVTADAIGIGL